jgi:hypothetical protein
VRKADKFAATWGHIVYKVWNPQHLTMLWTSTVCYRDSFTILLEVWSAVKDVSRIR